MSLINKILAILSLLISSPRVSFMYQPHTLRPITRNTLAVAGCSVVV